MTNKNVTARGQQKLVIISGSTGDLGREYLNYYSQQDDTVCYGLTRRDETYPVSGVTYLRSDLEEAMATREQIQRISLEGVVKILLIHPVGKFKFEANGLPEIDKIEDGIDDEVFTSNVDTFHNIVKPLIEQRGKHSLVPMKLVAFGSLSDSYSVPWWGSYSKSKLILRPEMRYLSRMEPQVESLFINLSSVKTSNESRTRPYADTRYWLKPEEVVAKSTHIIEKMQPPYQEIDLFNPSPIYRESYYRDHDKLRKKWIIEMKRGTQK